MAIWSDVAQWRGPTVNHGGRMLEQRGLVLHIAEGSYLGTIAWQKNRTASVSSHFVVDLDGAIAQVVDTDVTAWTQILGNGHWLSVENAGHTPHALTDAQVEANAILLARCHIEYRVPLQLANAPSGRGLGHHSMGAENGVNWGHSECPGPAIKAQKPAILARAIEIVNGVDDMTPAQFLALLQDPKVAALMRSLTWQYADAGQPSAHDILLNPAGELRKTLAAGGSDLAALKAALLDPAVLKAIATAVNDDSAARLKA